MKNTGVAMLKSRLSEFLAAVKAGEEISVTERGQLSAGIVPIYAADQQNRHLAELERIGLLKSPAKSLDASFWRLARSSDAAASVRSALAAEREESW